MPTYVFQCMNCKRQFEKVLSVSKRNKAKLECPHCASARIYQLMTSFYGRPARDSQPERSR
ncbi:MAG: zinc ribbon domain-containing protein [bacterium]|nr:zinc ribbon domain-containing protein [bacterium]